MRFVMKVTGIKTHVLQRMLGEKAFGWSQRVTHSRQTAICVVSTDKGIQGVGEAFYFGGPSKIAAGIMGDVFGPLLTGRDPFDNSVIWDNLYNWTRDQGMKGVTISALSGTSRERPSGCLFINYSGVLIGIRPGPMPPVYMSPKMSPALRMPWLRRPSGIRKRAFSA
jgi:hypothetical protein